MNKTYIVEWTKKNRRGAWRDYRRLVETCDVGEYIRGKMGLSLGTMGRNGMFCCATEVEKSNRFGYEWKEVKNGEYWFSKDMVLVCGSVTWKENYFDSKLRGWSVG